MSKKHFIALADVVKALEPPALPFEDKPVDTWSKEEYQDMQYALGADRLWGEMRDTLADFCQAQNPNFKRDRWIGYINGECGSNEGAVKGGKVR